jgi:hypothetical protein
MRANKPLRMLTRACSVFCPVTLCGPVRRRNVTHCQVGRQLVSCGPHPGRGSNPALLLDRTQIVDEDQQVPADKLLAERILAVLFPEAPSPHRHIPAPMGTNPGTSVDL